MYQTAVISATTLSRIAGPVCITRVAMRPAKSFWKNDHDLAHDVPVALPADPVRDVGGDRLVGDQRLGHHRDRARDQQHECHQQKQRPEFLEQLVRRVRRQQGDDAPDEHRDHGVEQRDHETGGEQRQNSRLRLARIMPIEREQARRRLRALRRLRGFQLPLEKSEHGALNNMAETG